MPTTRASDPVLRFHVQRVVAATRVPRVTDPDAELALTAPSNGTPPRVAAVGTTTINRALITKGLAKFAEVSALVLAVGYVLGLAVLAGQLRALGLHNTVMLTGFEHDDVLMKGLGALFTHVPTLLTLVLVIGTAVNERVRLFVRDVFSPAEERSIVGRNWTSGQVIAARAASGVLLLVVLLTSLWWEGTVVMLGLFGYLLVAVRFPTLRSPNAILVAGGAGLLVIGVMSTYVHAKPPPDIRIVTSDDRTIEGGLLGKGEGGEWYVVQYDHQPSNGLDDGQLELVPEKLAVDIELEEPPETSSRLLYQVLFGE